MPYVKGKGWVKSGRGTCGMLPGWTHQNKLNESPDSVPSSEEMLNLIWGIPNRRTQMLAMILYLTAGRISEVLDLFPAKFGDRKAVDSNGKQYKILLIRMMNEKNRKQKTKDIPLDYAKFPKEIRLIKNWIAQYSPFQNIFLNIYKARAMSSNSAYTLIKTATGFNPHWLRHIRISNRFSEEGHNEQKLKILAGWTDTRPASVYTKARWTDII